MDLARVTRRARSIRWLRRQFEKRSSMKTLYLDIFSGISGDMLLGALVALGVDAGKLENELKKLRLDGYHLHVGAGMKSQIHGIKVDVHLSHDQYHGHEHSHSHEGGVEHSHGHSHEH